MSQILSLLRLHVSPATLPLLNFAVRKLAHLTEYAIFAPLLYISLLGADELQWRPRTALWSAVIAAAYSLTDEFHQSFVPNRTASLADCALDTTGAILGLVVTYVAIQLLGSGRRKPSAREANTMEV